jgi:hypothetical protein
MNDKLAGLDPLCRLLFIGLWTISDREGKLKDNPRRIKAEILPYDDCDVDKFLDDLHRAHFIIRYTALEDSGTSTVQAPEGHESAFILVRKFSRHQNPHKNEPRSIIPDPPTDSKASSDLSYNSGTSTVQAPEGHYSNREDIKVKDIKIKGLKVTRNEEPKALINITDPLKEDSGKTLNNAVQGILLRCNLLSSATLKESMKISGICEDNDVMGIVTMVSEKSKSKNDFIGKIREVYEELTTKEVCPNGK